MSPGSRTCSEIRKLFRHSVRNISRMFSENSQAYDLMIYNIFSHVCRLPTRDWKIFALANSLDNINRIKS